ncbi:MAG: hypothetical protein VCA36_13650 [Opitutales bacterium]
MPISFLALGLCLCGAGALDDKVADEPKPAPPQNGWTADDLDRKLQVIRVPEVNFFEVPLTDALNSLRKLAVEHDPEAKTNPKFAGVQFVLLTREDPPPKITLRLRNARLRSILNFTVELIGYDYDVRDGAIVVFKPKPRPPKKQVFRQLETKFFELNGDIVRRLGGR